MLPENPFVKTGNSFCVVFFSNWNIHQSLFVYCHSKRIRRRRHKYIFSFVSAINSFIYNFNFVSPAIRSTINQRLSTRFRSFELVGRPFRIRSESASPFRLELLARTVCWKEDTNRSFFFLMDLLRCSVSQCMPVDLHVMKILWIRFNPFILRFSTQLLSEDEEEYLCRREVKTWEPFHRFGSAQRQHAV